MKIDTSTIKGFDEMSAEEKVNALLGVEMPEEVDLSGYVKKDLFDKASSELANAKKQIKERMTEDELAKAKAEAERTELNEKYEALLKETTASKYKAKYLAQGYDEKLAEATANALMSGDMDTVFANGEKFKVEMEKRIKAEVLKGTPAPNGADNKVKTVTAEQFHNMDYSARVDLYTNNRELYNELMNGGTN